MPTCSQTGMAILKLFLKSLLNSTYSTLYNEKLWCHNHSKSLDQLFLPERVNHTAFLSAPFFLVARSGFSLLTSCSLFEHEQTGFHQSISLDFYPGFLWMQSVSLLWEVIHSLIPPHHISLHISTCSVHVSHLNVHALHTHLWCVDIQSSEEVNNDINKQPDWGCLGFVDMRLYTVYALYSDDNEG